MTLVVCDLSPRGYSLAADRIGALGGNGQQPEWDLAAIKAHHVAQGDTAVAIIGSWPLAHDEDPVHKLAHPHRWLRDWCATCAVRTPLAVSRQLARSLRAYRHPAGAPDVPFLGGCFFVVGRFRRRVYAFEVRGQSRSAQGYRIMTAIRPVKRVDFTRLVCGDQAWWRQFTAQTDAAKFPP